MPRDGLLEVRKTGVRYMTTIDKDLDNTLKTLGICPMDLQQALLLTRDFRIKAIEKGLDPKATRIAILFMELTDRHFSQQKLHPTEMTQLHIIARTLFKTAKELNKGRM